MKPKAKRKAARRVRGASFKKGETVIVLSGAHKGKTGKVLQVMPRKGAALVEGVNLVKKHMRKTQEQPNGGIVSREAPMSICKLATFDSGRKTAGKTA